MSNMIKLKNLITEFGGKQFKGAEGIPANKSLEKISKTEKLNIIKGKGNIIDFIVPDEYKGKRNFWQVISAGNIKKSSSGKYVMLMGGGLINSPSFDTIDDLIDGVNWKSMEDRRRFNESINENVSSKYANEFQSYFYKKYKGKSFNGWKLTIHSLEGTFEWNKSGKDSIMATPFWDNGELVPVEITTDDGEQVFFKAHLFNSTGDINTDEANYLKIMKQYLK